MLSFVIDGVHPHDIGTVLDRHGVAREQVASWAVHPGGPRILGAVEESLGLRPERHIAILKYGLAMLWSFGAWNVNPIIPLFAFVGLRGIDRNMLRSWGWLTGAAILSTMVAGYYLVYLVTPGFACSCTTSRAPGLGSSFGKAAV